MESIEEEFRLKFGKNQPSILSFAQGKKESDKLLSKGKRRERFGECRKIERKLFVGKCFEEEAPSWRFLEKSSIDFMIARICQCLRKAPLQNLTLFYSATKVWHLASAGSALQAESGALLRP